MTTTEPQSPAEGTYPACALALTVDQVSALTGVPRMTLYPMIQRGDFPGGRVGGRVMVPARLLVTWLVEQGLATNVDEAARLIESRCPPARKERRRRRVTLGLPIPAL